MTNLNKFIENLNFLPDLTRRLIINRHNKSQENIFTIFISILFFINVIK